MSIIKKIKVNNVSYDISGDSSQTIISSNIDLQNDNSSANFNIGDINGNIIVQFKNGHIKTKNFDSNNNNINENNLTLIKRRGVASFSFDDNPSQDEQIKDIFKEFNVRCGFAIIQASSRYKTYYDDGFEILAHGGGSWASGKTETEVRDLLSSQKKNC